MYLKHIIKEIKKYIVLAQILKLTVPIFSGYIDLNEVSVDKSERYN